MGVKVSRPRICAPAAVGALLQSSKDVRGSFGNVWEMDMCYGVAFAEQNWSGVKTWLSPGLPRTVNWTLSLRDTNKDLHASKTTFS